jgi:hypothetical protein
MSKEKLWISIERLLNDYSVPVLADAAKNHKLQTINLLGQRILATDGDVVDKKSKAYALEYLANRYAMQQDPGPYDYLFDERLEIEGSPLDLFGWPEDQLPNFNDIQPHFQNPQAQKSWTQRSLKEFEEELRQTGSLAKAGELHGVSRQRYSEILKDKRDAANWGKV